MDIPVTTNQSAYDNDKMSKTMKRLLLLLNCVMLGLGNCGGPQVQKLYFVNGGKRVWLTSCLETAGWPFLLIPILISYLYRRSKGVPGKKPVSIRPALIIPCAIIGILMGADDYMYSYGVSCLPVSTSALLIATQLAFTAGFAFLLVKQKFTPFSINAIFLLCIGAVVLAFHTSSDRPANESNKQYYLGFFLTLGAAALYGFVLPAIELMCKRAKQTINYSLVMEMQVVMSFFATAVCIIGMIVNHDFEAIPREAREFELGEVLYYTTLMLNALLWQFFFLGATGVIRIALCDYNCYATATDRVLGSFVLPRQIPSRKGNFCDFAFGVLSHISMGSFKILRTIRKLQMCSCLSDTQEYNSKITCLIL